MIAALLAAIGAVHPESSSISVLTVDGATVRLEQRVQVESLLEVIDSLDADGDRFVSQSELDRRQEQIFAYVEAHYRLRTNTGGALEGGELLAPRAISLVLAAPEPGALALPVHTDAVFEYQAREPLEELVVESSLFLETSPAHRDFASVVWEGERAGTVVLDASTPQWRFRPRDQGVWADFFRVGVTHILETWDHLAFLAALLLATRSARSLLGVVAAFAVAYSAALALAVAGWIDLSSNPRFVGAAMALSIAYVAADHLLSPARTRAPWVEALVFGLVHGLGLAAFLESLLVMERSRTSALLAFNLGVEAGQLAALGGALLVLLVLRRLTGASQEANSHAPRWLRVAGSCVLAVLGLVVFVRRAFG